MFDLSWRPLQVVPPGSPSSIPLLDRGSKFISIIVDFETDCGKIVSRWVFLIELVTSGVTTCTTFSSLSMALK